MNVSDLRFKTIFVNLLLFCIFLGYLAINAGPVWVQFELRTDHDDMAKLYMHHGTPGYEAFSQPYPMLKGVRRIAYRLPPYWKGSDLRLDPGDQGQQYGILRAHWYGGFLDRTQPLDELSALSGQLVSSTENAGEWVASADAQIRIPSVSPQWRQAALVTAYAPAFLLLFALGYAGWRRRIGPVGVASIYVAAIGLTYCYFCLRFGANLPVFDDWRYVLPGPLSLIQGHWQWLLATGNDTYFLTGQIIDFLCLELFNIDFLPIRVVALALLLLNVWWVRKTVIAVNADRWLVAAMAITLCIWSFIAGRLWGGSAMAYHQAIPTFCSSLMLVHLVGAQGMLRPRYNWFLLVGAALASGLAYISGGLMVIALGSAVLLVGAAGRLLPNRRAIMFAGVAILLLGVGLMAFQFGMVTHYQGSLLDHNHAVSSVYPNDRRFWLSFFAQFGSGFGYAGYSGWIDAGLTALAVVPALLIGSRLLLSLRQRAAVIERPGLILVVVYAGAASIIYAGVVAFGRAGFVDVAAAPEMMTAMAKSRLLFWPISALLPFFFLGWMEISDRFDRKRILAVAVAALFLYPKSPAPFDLITSFDYMATKSVNGAYCAAAGIQRGDAVIGCPEAAGDDRDLAQGIAIMHARNAKLYRELESFETVPKH